VKAIEPIETFTHNKQVPHKYSQGDGANDTCDGQNRWLSLGL